jgi:hypothetical protein
MSPEKALFARNSTSAYRTCAFPKLMRPHSAASRRSCSCPPSRFHVVRRSNVRAFGGRPRARPVAAGREAFGSNRRKKSDDYGLVVDAPEQFVAVLNHA